MCEDNRMNERNKRDKESWLFDWMNKRRGRDKSPSFFVVCNIVAYFMNKNKQNQEITLNNLIS
jgi:hypothetical protein